MFTYDSPQQSEADTGLPIKVDRSPSVPEPKQPLRLNQAEVDKWISEEPDPQFKIIKQKIVDNLAIVPHEVFTSALKSCTEELNKQLVGQKYAVLWDFKPHASKRWVYEQIKNDLTTPPVTETYFGSYDQAEEYKSFRKLLDQGIDTFVVTDDAIYSGEQFRKTMKHLIRIYKEYRYFPDRQPRVVLMAPYMTNGFKDSEYTKQAQAEGLVEIISNRTMPSLGEVLSDEDIAAINKRGLTLDLPEHTKQRSEGDLNYDTLYYGATLTAFDHRVADGHSFCEPVSYRLGLDAPKPYADETTDYFKAEEAAFEDYKNPRLEKQDLKKKAAKTAQDAL